MMELFIGENPPHNVKLLPPPMTVTKRQEAQAGNGMWFGPRLGRRKRDVENRKKRNVDDKSDAGINALGARFQRSDAKANGMWFGPRLGRRKRDDEVEATREKRRIDEGLEIPYTYSQEGPWTIVSLKGKAHFSFHILCT